MPLALWFLAGGMLLPFVLVMIGLAIGFITLELHRRGQYERSAAGQVYGTLATGLVAALWPTRQSPTSVWQLPCSRPCTRHF